LQASPIWKPAVVLNKLSAVNAKEWTSFGWLINSPANTGLGHKLAEWEQE
jgi:hypothetical protein